jgi:predicted transcriptional regulator
MYKNLKEALTLLTLSDTDIKIFIEILELQKVNVLRISTRLNIDRRRVASSLKNMTKIGVVQQIGNKYELINLDQIPALLEFQLHELTRLTPKLESELSQIKYRLEPTIRKVSYYSGKNSYISLFNSMLVESKTIYHIGDEKAFLDVVGEEYFKFWISKRVSKGIIAKDIATQSDTIKSLNLENTPNTHIKYLTIEDSYPGSIILFDGKVALFYSEIPKCILIDDTDFYNFFVFMWGILYKLIA